MEKSYSAPTAAKLVAFVTLGLTGYLANLTYEYTYEEAGSAFPDWIPLAGAMMFGITGWTGLGRRSGFGGSDSISKGLLYAIAATVYMCILYGLIFQGQALWHGQYLDPFRTIFDWFRVSFDFFADSFVLPVWGVLLLGGAISGGLTGAANWRWR